MNSNLIINADDFGLSESVNKAIIHCFNNGMINSTSLMANTPAFSEAVESAKENGFANCIGVHVTLTEGKPLTNFKHNKYLNEDGTWNQNIFSSGNIWLNKQFREDFSKEIEAQIDKVEKAGIKPSHINSHHHIHVFPSLIFLFLRICSKRKYKLRIAQTQFEGKYINTAYRNCINSIIKGKHLQYSDYFGNMEYYNQKKEKFKNNVVEIMVHPVFNGSGKLIDTLDIENAENKYQNFFKE